MTSQVCARSNIRPGNRSGSPRAEFRIFRGQYLRSTPQWRPRNGALETALAQMPAATSSTGPTRSKTRRGGLRRFAMVVVQQPAVPLTPCDLAAGARRYPLRLDHPVAEPLVGAIDVVVRRILRDCPPQVSLAERHDVIETRRFDGEDMERTKRSAYALRSSSEEG